MHIKRNIHVVYYQLQNQLLDLITVGIPGLADWLI